MRLAKYNVTQIDGQTYLIEELIAGKYDMLMYLLVGGESALLIDTGFGLGDLKGLVSSLTDKPVRVVLTHAHLDHFGGCGQFQSFCFHEADREVFALHQDPAYLRQMSKSMIPGYLMPLAKLLFGKEVHQITHPQPGENDTYIEDGHIFDLGGRTLETIATPGHTPGSVCLLERATGYLFSGDMVCDWGVLLNLECCCSLEVFLRSMRKLKARENEFGPIYPGHHLRPVTKGWLDDYIACAQQTLEGTLAPVMENKHRKVKYGKIEICLPLVPEAGG